jgi:hypothetical protein
MVKMTRPRFAPNAQQKEIASAFDDNARLLGAPETLRTLLNAAGTRFNERRIGELCRSCGREASRIWRGGS